MHHIRMYHIVASVALAVLFLPSCEKDIGQRYIFSGIVVDSETHNPVGDAFVEIRPDRQGLAYFQYLALRTDQNGRFYFSVNGFEKGETVTWRIYASAYNYFFDYDDMQANDLLLTTSDDNITLKLSPFDYEREFFIFFVYTNGITTNSRIECQIHFPGEAAARPMYPISDFVYADILINRDYVFYARGQEVNTGTQTWVLTCEIDTALRFGRESLSPLVYEVEFDDLKDTILFRKVVQP